MKRILLAVLLVGCTEYEVHQQVDPVLPGEDTSVENLDPVNPIAVPGVSQQVKRNVAVQLDGTESYDPDDEWAELSYVWSISSTPEGAVATLSDEATATPTLTADLLGVYTIDLVVTDADGLISENPATAVVEVIPYEDLYVELSWDTTDLDLDLHLINPEGVYYEDSDCYFGNPEPDWGAAGDATDNPSLNTDDEGGEMRESIELDVPEEGTYTLYVHYYNQRDAGVGYTIPTVDIRGDGQSLAVIEGPRLQTEGTVWAVGTLDWTTLTFTGSQTQTTHDALGGPSYND